jgi:hypothetical protein
MNIMAEAAEGDWYELDESGWIMSTTLKMFRYAMIQQDKRDPLPSSHHHHPICQISINCKRKISAVGYC